MSPREKFDLEAYPFRINPLSKADGGGYLIEFPDVPGCMSDGETPEEAIANGGDALKASLKTLREFGDPIPRPGSFGHRADSGGNACRKACTHVWFQARARKV